MLKSIDKNLFFVYNKKVVKSTYLGVAQLVACLNGVQEAASSNLATQTKRNLLPSWDSGFLLFFNIFCFVYCAYIFYNSLLRLKTQKSRGHTSPASLFYSPFPACLTTWFTYTLAPATSTPCTAALHSPASTPCQSNAVMVATVHTMHPTTPIQPKISGIYLCQRQ